jgi:hypothetical protein
MNRLLLLIPCLALFVSELPAEERMALVEPPPSHVDR